MPLKERRNIEKAALRQTILDAARDIAAEDGWQNVTIRKICTKIRYSAPIVYRYFESKEMLLQVLRKEGMAQMNMTIQKIHDREKEPKAQLVGYGLAFWKFAKQHPELYQVMFNLQGVICCEETRSSPVEEINNLYKEALKKLNKKAVSSDKHLLFLVDYFIAIVHGFIALNMVNKIKSGKENGEEIFRQSLKHFVESIEQK